MATFAWGLGFYGLAVFLPQLKAAHPGWSTGAISAGTTFYYLAGAGLMWFAGSVFARFGLRLPVLAGLACMAAGATALPFLTALWQLFAAYAVMAIGWAVMSTTGIATILARSFDRRRGLALSLALNGASFAGVAVSPVLLLLSREAGFATALPAVAGTMALLLAPLLWVSLAPGRQSHADLPPAHDGGFPSPSGPLPRSVPPPARGALLRSLAFWSVAAPFAIVLLQQVGFLTHQVAFLEGRIGAAQVALAVALTTGSAVAGRLALGLVIDRLDKRAVTAGSFALQIAALGIMLASRDALALYGACILYGLNVGNIITLPALIVQVEYPPAAYALVVGMVTAIAQFTYAFGPGLQGLLRDLAGAYEPGLVLCMALNAGAALLVLMRPGRRQAAAA